MLQVEQIKAARMLLGWDQAELAKKAGVSLATVKRLEAKPGHIGGTVGTANKLMGALQNAGVIFLQKDSQGGVGARLSR